MDRSLLRYITGTHVKIQNEFLYSETVVLNIEKNISNHKLMNFQTKFKRDDDEITKQVYICQNNNPVKGYWVELLSKDFKDLEMDMNEDIIKNETKEQFKSRKKKQLDKNMLEEIKLKPEGHSRIGDICYKNFKLNNI